MYHRCRKILKVGGGRGRKYNCLQKWKRNGYFLRHTVSLVSECIASFSYSDWPYSSEVSIIITDQCSHVITIDLYCNDITIVVLRHIYHNHECINSANLHPRLVYTSPSVSPISWLVYIAVWKPGGGGAEPPGSYATNMHAGHSQIHWKGRGAHTNMWPNDIHMYNLMHALSWVLKFNPRIITILD